MSLELTGRNFCSDKNNNSSTLDSLMMISHCCFIFGPMFLFVFVKTAKSWCLSCLIVLAGDKISNGFRLLYLSFV